MVKYLLTALLICLHTIATMGQWAQMNSSDLENAFSDAMIKHNGEWYFTTAAGVFKYNNTSLKWENVNNNLADVYGRLRLESLTSIGSTLLGSNRWDGVVKTSNAGATWQAANTDLPDQAQYGDFIQTIGTTCFITCTDENTATTNIYSSDNLGSNWTKQSEIENIGTLFSAGDSLIVVAMDTISRTTVNGTILNKPLTNFILDAGGIDNIFRDGNFLYAVTNGKASGIYRYDLINKDGWNNISSTDIPNPGFIGAGGNGDGKFYAWAFSEDGINFYTSTTGTTWTSKSITLPLGLPFSVGFHAVGDEFLANFIDAGLYYSNDAGATISSFNSGALATNYEKLIKIGNNITTNTFLSGAYFSTDGGSNWTVSSTGLPDEPLNVLGQLLNINGRIFANYSNSPGDNKDAPPIKSFYSDNYGANWSELTPPPGEDSVKIIGNNGSLIFGKVNSDNSDKYYRTPADIFFWTEITTNIPIDFNPYKIVGDGSVCYMIGLDNNDFPVLFRSTDNGDNWIEDLPVTTDQLMRLSDNGDMERLIAPEAETAFLVLTYEGYYQKLFRRNASDDGWTEVLPTPMGYFDIEKIYYANQKLYISQWQDGIYISFNEGNTFEQISGNVPKAVKIQDIIVDNGTIFISTEGFGIWNRDEPTTTNTILNTFSNQLVYPNPAQNILNISNEVQKMELYTTDGILVKTLTSDNTNKVKIDGIAKGIYILKIKTLKQIDSIKLIIQ